MPDESNPQTGDVVQLRDGRFGEVLAVREDDGHLLIANLPRAAPPFQFQYHFRQTEIQTVYRKVTR